MARNRNKHRRQKKGSHKQRLKAASAVNDLSSENEVISDGESSAEEHHVAALITSCKVFDYKNALSRQLHSVPVNGNRVKLEAKHLHNLEKAWGFGLIGRFGCRFQGEEVDIVALSNSWGVPCKLYIHSCWIVFVFEREQDRANILYGGPHSVLGRRLLLKNIPPFFTYEVDGFRFVPVWIKLPDLPLECYNLSALSMIASAVGKPISTDADTLSRERISYARVFVEVDATVEPVSSVEIELPDGRVVEQDTILDIGLRPAFMAAHRYHDICLMLWCCRRSFKS